jgi:hypothetical protein
MHSWISVFAYYKKVSQTGNVEKGKKNSRKNNKENIILLSPKQKRKALVFILCELNLGGWKRVSNCSGEAKTFNIM